MRLGLAPAPNWLPTPGPPTSRAPGTPDWEHHFLPALESLIDQAVGMNLVERDLIGAFVANRGRAAYCLGGTDGGG